MITAWLMSDKSFVDLPAEMRLRIYHFVFIDLTFSIGTPHFSIKHESLVVLFVSRRIRVEALVALYGAASFRITDRHLKLTTHPAAFIPGQLRAAWTCRIQHITIKDDSLLAFTDQTFEPPSPLYSTQQLQHGAFMWSARHYLPVLQSIHLSSNIDISWNLLRDLKDDDSTVPKRLTRSEITKAVHVGQQSMNRVILLGSSVSLDIKLRIVMNFWYATGWGRAMDDVVSTNNYRCISPMTNIMARSVKLFSTLVDSSA